MAKHALALVLGLVIVFTFIQCNLKSAVGADSTIFSDGFESGDFSAWTTLSVGGGSSATIANDNPHHGSYNARFTAGSSDWVCVKKTFPATATAFVRCYYTFDTLPGVGERIYLTELRVFSNDGIGVAIENIDGDLFWLLRIAELGVSTEVYEAVASNPELGVPYCVEAKRDVTKGLEELWIDGVSRASANQNITRDSDEIIVGYGYSTSVNQQTCYADCVVVADAYIGPEDSLPPTFGIISSNTTVAGQSCSLTCLVNDEANVSAYISSTNNTGVWINDTAVAFSSFFNETAAWANVTSTLNDTVGNVVSCMWYANDTSNNWSHGDQYNLTITAVQHYLTVVSPYGTPGGEGWYDDSSTAYAALDLGILDHGNLTRRVFVAWSGDANGTDYALSDAILMDQNKTAVANWKTQYYMTVTSPYGSPVPSSAWYDEGTSMTSSVASPQPGPIGTRYVCTGWTGTGSVPSSGTGTSITYTLNEPSNITWNWETQYELTVSTDPAGLNPQPLTSPAGPWYNNSTIVNVTAQTVIGRYYLHHWTVDSLDKPPDPTIWITMNATHSAIAHYELDTSPPLITNLQQEPAGQQIEPAQSVNIQVTVTDNETGVKNVTLSYRTSPNNVTWSNWTDISMNTIAGDTYNGTIPGSSPGTYVQYKTTSFDNADNSATLPVALFFYYSVIPEMPLLFLAMLLLLSLSTLLILAKHRRFH